MPAITRSQKIHVLKIARKYVLIKKSLESPFKKELRKYFAEQSSRVAKGQDIETIAPVLDHHYRRVVRKLTGIKLKADDQETEDRILIILFGRAAVQAKRIDSTTNKYLRRSIELARAELAEAGELFPAQSTINRISSNIIGTYNRNRVGGIAIFETQALTEKIRDELTRLAEEMMDTAIFNADEELAREAAELAESQMFDEIADDIGKVPAGELFLASRLLMKTWVTIGDSKVRLWHQKAAFQTVLESEPFIVHNERLMHPGDMSMGASIENVANCRCSKTNL